MIASSSCWPCPNIAMANIHPNPKSARLSSGRVRRGRINAIESVLSQKQRVGEYNYAAAIIALIDCPPPLPLPLSAALLTISFIGSPFGSFDGASFFAPAQSVDRRCFNGLTSTHPYCRLNYCLTWQSYNGRRSSRTRTGIIFPRGRFRLSSFLARALII